MVKAKIQFSREPRIRVLRQVGAPCAVGYTPGDDFAVDPEWPEGSFRCLGAFRATEPSLECSEALRLPGSFPDCRKLGSCECPVSETVMVFEFYSAPAPVQPHSARRSRSPPETRQT